VCSIYGLSFLGICPQAFFTYHAADGSSNVVWYEDEKSIPLKSSLAVSRNLAGVSVFALGYDDLSFWQAVHAGGF
jgi:spore germination protein